MDCKPLADVVGAVAELARWEGFRRNVAVVADCVVLRAAINAGASSGVRPKKRMTHFPAVRKAAL